MNKKSLRLGDILISRKEITQEQLNESIAELASSNCKLGELLIQKNYVTELNVVEALSQQTGIEVINLDNYAINTEATKKISEKLARRTNSIPINIIDNKLLVAMSDPLNIFDMEDIELESNLKLEVVFAIKSQIIEAIDKYMCSRNTELAAKEIILNTDEVSLTNTSEDDYVKNSPVVRLIDSLIKQALRNGASDIHIEPFESKIRIRFRIDGELHEILNISINSHSAIVTRVKVMAGMNIAEKRLPQDGRIEMIIDSNAIDMRISVLPTVYGEKIVIRLLNRVSFLKTKKELGFTDNNLKIFDSVIESPNGIILVTGTTGCGKTTTMYAYLNELNKINKNIITVEDPVEYKIEGINQVQVNPKTGLTFANGLRSILRQDPDIIMIGEIRDTETAEIAVRAAITGHLVISTLHTNDAPSTIIRLQDMGIKTYLISASLKGILAQRLVKKICSNCKVKYQAGEAEKNLLELKNDVSLYKGRGCPKCYFTGYRGRIAIHEVMKVDKTICDIIYKGGSVEELKKAAVSNGMITLKENCRKLVMDGITTIDEYSQVIFKI
ncbi:MAG: GspE/PulE family protein [Sedimentibacter sp.]